VSTVYSKPSWQAGTGVPADGQRDVPDISATSAVHDAYVIQIQNQIFYTAGTSAATPSLASVMALVLQNTGKTQGNINSTLYTLATRQRSGGAAVFHDITGGNNSVPGVTGYNAGTGYDPVTGLGSVDAALLVNHWADATTAFTLMQAQNSATVIPGGSGTVRLTTAPTATFSASITLSVSGAPAGVTASFSPATIGSPGSGSSTLSLTVGSVAPGSYPLTIIANGGGMTQSTTFTLNVAGFTLAPSASSVTVPQGSSGTVTLTTALQGSFNAAVSLSVSGLPTGVTGTFASSTLNAPGSGSSVLTLKASAGATPGTYSITVTATGGGITKTSSIGVAVTSVPATFTLTQAANSAAVVAASTGTISVTTTATSTFKSAVALSVSGAPAGVTASFSPASIASPGTGASTLSIKVGASVTPGAYSLTITATGGSVTKTTALTLNVVGFRLTASTSSVTIAQGGNSKINLSATPQGSFKATVALSISKVPSGMTATFSSPNLALNGNVILTVGVTGNATVGTYSLTVTGTANGVIQTVPISLTVKSSTKSAVASEPGNTNSANLAVSQSSSGGQSGADTAVSAKTVSATTTVNANNGNQAVSQNGSDPAAYLILNRKSSGVITDVVPPAVTPEDTGAQSAGSEGEEREPE
jgi:hypothetical protein